MFYVYRFLDKKKNIIYVGKSRKDLEQRFRTHFHLPKACYNLTYRIEYIECATESDMSIKEIYYINKYRHNGTFFNVSDTMDVPTSINFNDKWKQYRGPLNSHFSHSINYIKGYTSSKEVRYNKDGTIDRRKSNSTLGLSVFVDALTVDEVNLIIGQLISDINCAENKNQEQIRFRNLVVFVLGINIPHKLNEYICLKYRDFFNENDQPKTLKIKMFKSMGEETLDVPLKDVVRKTLLAYVKYLGWNYDTNANDVIFQTREHKTISNKTWWKILTDAASRAGIEKNIGVESQRKTYGVNIYCLSENKLNALLFLGEVWGRSRESHVINYLNLTDKSIDRDYYFGEYFSLGEVDLSKIMCLNPHN